MTPQHDDPFTSDTAELLVAAAQQLRDADKLMARLEAQQNNMLGLLHQTVEVIEKLEIERNTWRFRAMEMEGERNRALNELNAVEVKYREAARRAAELAARTNENHCPECGSSNIQLSAGDRPTGATAMDGADDTRCQYMVVCLACGHNEEAP